MPRSSDRASKCVGTEIPEGRAGNKIEFLNRKKLKFDWDNDELDESENLVQDSMCVDTPTQIPGIELKSEIKISGLAVTTLPRNSDAKMAATANAGFANVPAATAAPAIDVIVIDDNIR